MDILAISDKEDSLLSARIERAQIKGPGVVVSCGDLRPGYLDCIATTANAPLLFVRGNHDTDERGYLDMGGTPLDEQYIITRKVDELLKKHELKVHRYYVGEYVTSLEMAGVSISIMQLDEELKKYLDAPAQTPFFVQL